MEMTVIRGAVAPEMLRRKEHPKTYEGLGDTFFKVGPAPGSPAEFPEGSVQHKVYKEVAYLDGADIDDYTLVEDEAGIMDGMEGTRIPRTNAGNTGGFHLRDSDPWGQLFLYGTEDEEWLEEPEYEHD